MFTQQGLEAQLHKWQAEFNALELPAEKLPAFLAGRLIEAGIVEPQDLADVVRARIGGAVRNVCIRGRKGQTGFLDYVEADKGRMGFGIVQVMDVLREDHPKLAEILDRLEGVKA